MQDENTTKAQIVIVEDQESLAEIYKTRLELIGYKCAVASDGIQALVEIEKNRPQLVLLDLMLPKLSGEQILKVMRSSDWGEDIKVIIISNLNEADAPAGLRELRIEGYVVKANLTDDQVDQIVGAILKPLGQTESISLDGS
ncbi:MAG TPA: response regulator [Candidatus Saccharimonadales bacterium]|nr:response regulator [Candidatus Saccharimonadales bacterium]